MKAEDFKRFCPGRLEPIGGGHVAFVPSELPASFSCGADLLTQNDAALLALGELRAIVPFMPNPELVTYPFLRREAILSSKIEGTHTELEQLYLFEAEPRESKASDSEEIKDAREVHNYVVALELGLERLKSLPICSRLLRDMHAKLLSSAAFDRGQLKSPGEFRKEQVYIGSHDIASARYVPPPFAALDELMDNLAEYIHSKPKYHPALVRIAVAHYQFEAIHPFADGNGRIGRLLISLLLSSWGILPQPLLYLSAYFEKHRDEYLQRLWLVSRDDDWHGWLKFFLQGVYEEAKDATNRAKRLLGLREEYRRRLQGKREPSSALTIIDSLFRYPFITVSDAAKQMDQSYNSGKKNIDKLVKAGILSAYDDRAWGKLYYAKEVLDVLA